MRWTRVMMAAAITGGIALAPPARAWDAHGHRLITRLALDGLPPEMPASFREPAVIARIVEQSAEPDRWRGVRRPSINHEDNQDHYIDLEDLEQFGLTLETVPRLRYEYLRVMILAKERAPERMQPYSAADDPDRNKEWPGFLPHAIANDWAKLVAAMQTMRIIESLDDPARRDQLELARANVIHHMGVLSHWVGDAAQPLHTTRHHHGWVGDNPKGYTTDRGFHAYIDGWIIEHHAFTSATLNGRALPEVRIDPADPWPQCIAYIRRSWERVEPLYELQRTGALQGDEGKAFIAERLTDAGSMLAGLYAAAWTASTPKDADAANYLKYNNFKPDALGLSTTVP